MSDLNIHSIGLQVDLDADKARAAQRQLVIERRAFLEALACARRPRAPHRIRR